MTGTEVEKDIDQAKMYNDQARVPGNQNAGIRDIRIIFARNKQI